ncbi:hypothetical protein HZA96_02005 [Candidatus Woesearchaeota archaeon]|nr:hypothetical protein [Candidatus Woesearchaeota archaeon]
MKITFIEAPHEWQDRDTIKVRNYGIERIISNLICNGILSKENVSCYDFSFDCMPTKQEAYIYLQSKLELIKDSDIFGISVMETNYSNSLLLAALLKMKFPESKILFGGPAVSELDKEIMQLVWQTDQNNNISKIGFVDFLIPGMAEEAVLTLVQHFKDEQFQKVHNLIWIDNGKLVSNPIKYPPTNWKTILPIDMQWNTNGKYKDDHFLLLASYGCYANCDFCAMIIKEPYYIEREMPYIIEEIQSDVEIARKRGVDKIFIQPIHQNYAHRIGQFMEALEKAKVIIAGIETYLSLVSKISGIGLTSRADTLLIARNRELIESTIKRYPEIQFQLFVGIENFSDEIMKEIGKTVPQRINAEAMKFLVYLQTTYKNFSYLLSFIGLTHNTQLKHIKENINIMQEIFVTARSLYPVHYFLQQPLRLGVKMARKFSIQRAIGYYLEDNYGKVNIPGNLAYPKDKKTQQFLERYYAMLPNVPEFSMRKRLYDELMNREIDIIEQASQILQIEKNIIEQYFLWTELSIANLLLDNKDADSIVSVAERTYYYGLQILQRKLEQEKLVRVRY